MQIVRKTFEQLSTNQKTALDSHSFFTSTAFSKLWESIGGKPVWWTAEDKDSFTILPGIEFGISKLKRFQAMTDGLYANFVTSQILMDIDCSKEMLTAIGNYEYAKVFIFDFQNQFSYHSIYQIEKLSTILVDITDSEWLPPDKKMQSELRKAERENILIEKFDTAKHMDKFLTLMTETEKRHGRKPKYPEKFYRNLADLSQVDERILWFWCEHKGNPVSSHINFIEQQMLFNWQVFYDKEFSFLKANQKMLYDMVQKYQNGVFRYLNLGASPPDAESLVEYKMKYGGEIYTYKMLTKKNLAGKLL